jgi:tight adherence protein C
MNPLYFILALGLFACLMLSFLIYQEIVKRRLAAKERILSYGPRSARATVAAASQARRRRREITEQLAENVKALRAQWGIKETPRLRRQLVTAGLLDPIFTEVFMALQIALPVAGMVAVASFRLQLIPIAAAGIAGWLAPDYFLKYLTKRRQRNLRRAMPEFVDLLLICINAGLGIDQAIKRVAEEIELVFPALYEELQIVMRLQSLGRSRLEAWKDMLTRTHGDEIRGFVSMLDQSDKFGTPISNALRTYANQMRLSRRQDAEKRAAKVPVKMLFPLVLFIFPCIFVVLLGPPVIEFLSGAFKISYFQPAVSYPQEEYSSCTTQYKLSPESCSFSSSPLLSSAGVQGRTNGQRAEARLSGADQYADLHVRVRSQPLG